ncbi:MAG: manganese-dependent inorganic pyrophosphatase [Desulfovibrionaceae bacterium]
MEEIIVVGHKNPDTDSIISAIALSYLYTQLGKQSSPFRQGNLAPETLFVLEKSNLDMPPLLGKTAGRTVALVDHSDYAQAPTDIKDATICAIVDHHKLGDITTSTPLDMWIHPWGCTATIVKMLYDTNNIEIPTNIATGILCAILSDTVLFKSPTSTKKDEKAVEELSQLLHIDKPLDLGMQMFIAKSDISNASSKDLLFRDYKEFTMGRYSIGVGQLEVVDISLFDTHKENLLEELKRTKKENNLHTVVLLLTDIMKEGSLLLYASEDKSNLEKAFSKCLDNDEIWLDGVISRKKQIIPFLQNAFS